MGDNKQVPLPNFSKNICIVLVRPENDGNIGAVARNLMNFGIMDLRVIGHNGEWSETVRKRAKNAQLVLQKAKVFDSLEQAIYDCSLVIGTSGKREGGNKTAYRHFLNPDELPSRLKNTDGRIGIVFGPEGKGLLNHELKKCDLLVNINTWQGYPILNLSHAVSIICYSWFNNNVELYNDRLLDPQLRRKLRIEIKRLVKNMNTKDHRREGIEDTLLRVIMRGLPKDDEIHRILSVITQAADSFQD